MEKITRDFRYQSRASVQARKRCASPSLSPNAAYTAIVTGKNLGTGVGLVEAYDLDQAADSQLANIITPGLVEAGDNVMIGGIIVGGDADVSVLVRAIGPSLAHASPPVPGALPDPILNSMTATATPSTDR